ncbi:MAG TPA: glycosyltransferase [Solirubrobacteraceae bacterium]|nr:glycosyltransferase [Solirubrobacteraceae bacterium]
MWWTGSRAARSPSTRTSAGADGPYTRTRSYSTAPSGVDQRPRPRRLAARPRGLPARPAQGVDVLLLALARLAQAGVAFRGCVVGPGRLLAAHRTLATELGLGGRVAIAGRVEDLRPYYAAADVFVLPSLAELATSLTSLVTDAARRAHFAARARSVYERRLSPEQFASALAEVYAEVATAPRLSAARA